MATVLASRRRGPLFFAVFLAAIAIYAPRTCRTVTIMGDSAELVAAAKQWGVPHPPGYPLYTTVAHLFASLPFVAFPHSVHLTSALFHAVTAGFVACTIDVVAGSLVAALIGAFALILSETFFAGSLYAEVFPLNDLFFAALLFLGARVAEDGARIAQEGAVIARGTSETLRTWIPLAAVLGLAFSHHPMIVLAVPALLVLLAPALARSVRARPSAMALALAVSVALPVAFYALLLVAAERSPLPSWGDLHDLRSLVRHVTRQDYGGPLHASRHFAAGQRLERYDAFTVTSVQSFGWGGVLLFVGGVVVAIRRKPQTGGALLLAWFFAGPLFAVLNAVDINSEFRRAFFARFFTMSHVAIAIFIGLGFAALEPRIRARLTTPLLRAAVTTIAAMLTLAPLLGHVGSVDLRDDTSGLAYARDLVTTTPEDALLLLKSDATSQAALYICAVEDSCGHRIVLTPGQLWMPWKRNELRRRYPDFELPPEGITSPTRWLVDAYTADRPIFVHPELLDEAAHGDIATIPSLLLYRVYRDEPSLRGDLPNFRAELHDMIDGGRCAGCPLMQTAPRSAAAAQLAKLYDAAILAHQRAATELGLTDEAAALAKLRAPTTR